MKHQDFTGILPEQKTGKEIEAEASVEMPAEEQAISFYTDVKNRLLEVNNWHKVAGYVSGKFQIADATGEVRNKSAATGDYIRVDIPGPGSKKGDGYDWVIIEDIIEVAEGEMQSIGMRVRPTANPTTDDQNIAHFYDDSATSNFIITRIGTTVTALIVDRNVKPNDDTASLIDQVRHVMVGVGAIGAFSKGQWQNLVDGLVKKNK